MLVGGRIEQELGAVGGPGADGHDVAGVDLAVAVAGDDDPGDGAPGAVGLQLGHLGPCEQGDVGPAEQRPDRDDLGVGFGVGQAGVPVAPGAADAGGAGPVLLVQHDPARCVERVVAGLGQVIGDLLEPGLVGDGGPGVGLAAGTLGRVLAGVAVHLVQPLGFGV